LAAALAPLAAQDGTLHFAPLGDLKLASGKVIRDCRIGYRTFGRLDAAQSNAILFPPWFTVRR
jgi:homoserine O-acetyltransferase